MSEATSGKNTGTVPDIASLIRATALRFLSPVGALWMSAMLP
jgi:hypothetical protein